MKFSLHFHTHLSSLETRDCKLHVFLLLFRSKESSALAWLCCHTTALKNAILHNQSTIPQCIQKLKHNQ